MREPNGTARNFCLAEKARWGEWASQFDWTSLVCGARRQREWEGGRTLFPEFLLKNLTQAYFMGGETNVFQS